MGRSLAVRFTSSMVGVRADIACCDEREVRQVEATFWEKDGTNKMVGVIAACNVRRCPKHGIATSAWVVAEPQTNKLVVFGEPQEDTNG